VLLRTVAGGALFRPWYTAAGRSSGRGTRRRGAIQAGVLGMIFCFNFYAVGVEASETIKAEDEKVVEVVKPVSEEKQVTDVKLVSDEKVVEVTKSVDGAKLVEMKNNKETIRSEVEKKVKDYNNKTIGFFSFGLGGSAMPLRGGVYYGSSVELRYGAYISNQSFFEAGVDINTETSGNLHFKYGYDFIKGSKWVPGIDLSLLLGYNVSRDYRNYNDLLEISKEYWVNNWYVNSHSYISLGFAIGPYIKTYISDSKVLVLRTGIKHTDGWSRFNIRDIRVYMNLAMQWYF